MKTLSVYQITMPGGALVSLSYERPASSSYLLDDLRELLPKWESYDFVDEVTFEDTPGQPEIAATISKYLSFGEQTRFLAEHLVYQAKNGLEDLRDRLVKAECPYIEFAGLRIEVLP